MVSKYIPYLSRSDFSKYHMLHANEAWDKVIDIKMMCKKIEKLCFNGVIILGYLDLDSLSAYIIPFGRCVFLINL